MMRKYLIMLFCVLVSTMFASASEAACHSHKAAAPASTKPDLEVSRDIHHTAKEALGSQTCEKCSSFVCDSCTADSADCRSCASSWGCSCGCGFVPPASAPSMDLAKRVTTLESFSPKTVRAMGNSIRTPSEWVSVRIDDPRRLPVGGPCYITYESFRC